MIKRSHSEKETMALAAGLAGKVDVPAFICLTGGLGSGKTVFAKGFAEGLGIPPESIKSPTYTFMRKYKIGRKHLYHFDFYRIESADDLMENDLREIFEQKNAYFLIEWPERIAELLPKERHEIKFEYAGEDEREITFENDGK
jgi:tRNA threonylcarbamoyladenosine biosynthesis protein TsaE